MTKYSEAFKQEIYRRLTAGETPRALAEETGASRRTLENWKAIMKKQNADSIEPEIELYVLEPETENEKETEKVDKFKLLEDEYSKLRMSYIDIEKRFKILENENSFWKEEYQLIFDRYLALRTNVEQ